jgi:signal transduction histidine kinase
MTFQEKINVIKETAVFKTLSNDDFKHIAEVAEVLYYKRGDIIFEENAMADAFYIIAEGGVEILKKGKDNSQEVLAVKRAVDVFGEMAVIDDLPRSATIRANTDLVILKLAKDIFSNLLRSFSHISLEVARSICHTVRQTNVNYINDLESTNKQLKNAYIKLKKTQNELIQAEKLSLVGKFASLIIHDIKNPMTNIKAYAELIKMNNKENNKVQKSVKVIVDEVDRLTNMASELLEFSRGEIHLNKTPVNMSAFVSTMIDMVKEDLKKKNIIINLLEMSDSVVMVDMQKMKRVFFNLISNASDALLSGGKIVIRIIDEGSWVKWAIMDNGIGMEPEVLKKIFEPFFSHSKNGTGLGMTIVKGIIESHNGHIIPYSKKNSGTRFDIFLPRA